jgi:phage-related protein
MPLAAPNVTFGLTDDVNIHIFLHGPPDEPKPLIWRGSSQRDFAAFPRSTQREMGYALFLAQLGERHPRMAKGLKGFGGASVIEIRHNDYGSTYRAVYTVRFADAIYVLHAFQKKSKKGNATPAAEIDLVKKRLDDLIREKEQSR